MVHPLPVKIKKVKEYLKRIKSKIYTDTRIIDGECHKFCFPAICPFLLLRSYGLEISVTDNSVLLIPPVF
jgi:hypothetical protein